MATSGRLTRTPYFAFGRRPYRQERLLSYIHREHRRGRHLGEILDDPYVRRCGSPALLWATIRDTPLLAMLEQDVCEAIQRESEALANHE